MLAAAGTKSGKAVRDARSLHPPSEPSSSVGAALSAEHIVSRVAQAGYRDRLEAAIGCSLTRMIGDGSRVVEDGNQHRGVGGCRGDACCMQRYWAASLYAVAATTDKANALKDTLSS